MYVKQEKDHITSRGLRLCKSSLAKMDKQLGSLHEEMDDVQKVGSRKICALGWKDRCIEKWWCDFFLSADGM
jgi:hypothetical protein